MPTLLATTLGALIGLALGTLGGGSILTVPALVYLLGQNPHGAVGSSLVIVGANALVGAWLHKRAGHVRLGAALLFGAAGIVAAFGGARLSQLLPGPMLLILFALLMLVIASVMLRGQARPAQVDQPVTRLWQRTAGRDTHRSAFEKGVLWILRAVLPPARDNQEAADFLCDSIGTSSSFVQWAAVRPDTLLEGDISEYTLHENLVSSLFHPDSTAMANVAHFMCALVRSDVVWTRWSGKLPVIVNAATSTI